MKSIFWFALLLPLAGCQREPIEPTTAKPQPVVTAYEPGSIAQGEYMVKMGGCNDCHTPEYMDNAGTTPKEQWLIGSALGFHGPWGTTYPANLRLKAQEMDEGAWVSYTGSLHTRPMMPDFTLRAMREDDRIAIYRFLKSLGPAGEPAKPALPPGEKPAPPYLELVLPPQPKDTDAPSKGSGRAIEPEIPVQAA